ncbi:FMN-binding negative transcriptional regulator [Aestuariivirga sp.]|uniref:FMN-binding negative transcriptional regulator n=1 Tax=Aestuariivirga sp. TaxID=2650926 RepID=UPI0035931424
MYRPPAFRDDDPASLHATIRAARTGNLITSTAAGLMATPLPLMLDETTGPHGVLIGHVAKANPHWSAAPIGEALVIFMGPDAYVSPSWYATKAESGKVVPTWNYVTVHAHGPVEFFDDTERLLAVVSRLTDHHEESRSHPWKVSDAPDLYVQSQLRGIVGVQITITRLEGKRKLSQNRNAADREGVISGLSGSSLQTDLEVAGLMRNSQS